MRSQQRPAARSGAEGTTARSGLQSGAGLRASIFKFHLTLTMPTEAEPLQGRLALITGCTGGIGRATSLALARLGSSIAIHYHSAKGKASALADELKTTNAHIHVQVFQADLSDMDDVKRLHAEVVAWMGNPDILFNNAGITGPGARIGLRCNIEDASYEGFEHTWRTNTAQAFLLTQLCVPHMAHQGFGRVIFCSSVAAVSGGVSPHYASSKSALHGLMHWVAARYAKDGVTCNVVAPALVTGTEMLANPPEEYRKLIPVDRFGVPEDVVSCVEMLVRNGYMTNKIIVMDGGMTASTF
ncbi:short-chain dehydrogenases/reductases (SDR) family protein [Pleurotus pulmonarius]